MKIKNMKSVLKPITYMGGEVNMVVKDLEAVDVKFALAFPDLYDIGMSHLGLHILYNILNLRPEVACERVFAVWADMAEQMKLQGKLLSTIESATPIKNFDILGFSVSYELSFSNVLNMLDQAGIPLLSAERDESYPLVIGGGVASLSPEPVADFFDAFFIGEAEEGVLEIVDAYRKWKGSGPSRKKEDLLLGLTGIEGVYVPSFYKASYNDDGTIREIKPTREGLAAPSRRIVPSIEDLPYPARPLVPYSEIVHDRLSVEIARGCTQGCRFCQAGYTYRPVRERSPGQVLKIVREGLNNSGFDDVSLLSLSSGDYCCLEELSRSLMADLKSKRIAMSLPSMRVDTLSPDVIDQIRSVRKTGFTLAPETGSETLRKRINKIYLDEELLETTRAVFKAGWRNLKLYFMIGLPGETDDDLEAIVDLSGRIRREGNMPGKGMPQITVSISPFVPKAHTPFQWESMDDFEALQHKEAFLKERLKRMKGVRIKWQNLRVSLLEGVFSRGDRRLGSVLLKAHELGAGFDAWTEHFDFGIWQKAFEASGLSMDFYAHRRRSEDEVLPWDHLDAKVDKDFLLEELRKSEAGEATPDCKTGDCLSNCGSCDFDRVKPITQEPDSAGSTGRLGRHAPRLDSAPASRIRIKYSREWPMSFLSHLDLTRVWTRALRRADIPVKYSKGHHPMPRVSFGYAMPVGVESFAEYLDIEVLNLMRAEDIVERLTAVLPDGLKIKEGRLISPALKSLSVATVGMTYHFVLEDIPEAGRPTSAKLMDMAGEFMARESFNVEKRIKDGTKTVDLRPQVESLKVLSDTLVEVSFKLTGGSALRPAEAFQAIFNFDDELVSDVKTIKLNTILDETPHSPKKTGRNHRGRSPKGRHGFGDKRAGFRGNRKN